MASLHNLQPAYVVVSPEYHFARGEEEKQRAFAQVEVNGTVYRRTDKRRIFRHGEVIMVPMTAFWKLFAELTPEAVEISWTGKTGHYRADLGEHVISYSEGLTPLGLAIVNAVFDAAFVDSPELAVQAKARLAIWSLKLYGLYEPVEDWDPAILDEVLPHVQKSDAPSSLHYATDLDREFGRYAQLVLNIRNVVEHDFDELLFKVERGEAHDRGMALVMEIGRYLARLFIYSDEEEVTAARRQSVYNHLTSVLARNPEDIYARFNRSVALYYTGDYKGAVEEYEKVKDRLPKRTLWYQIEPILAYAQLGKDDTAMAMTADILTHENRAFSELYIIRGDILRKRGNEEAARAEYEKAVQYNSNLAEAKSRLASVTE